MRVIIFGATGYIGNSLCAFLRKKNIKIIKFSKKKKKTFFTFKDLNKIKNFNENDIVIHAAASGFEKYKSGKQLKNNNVSITKKILNFIKKKNIKNLIFFSSNSVYGKIESKYLTEDYRGKNLDQYGISKKISENLSLKFLKKNIIKKLLILRLPGVIGNRSKYNTISILRDKIINQNNVEIINGNLKFNSIICLENLNEFIYYSLKKKHYREIIINLGSKNPIKFINIVEKIKNKFNPSCKIINLKNERLHVIKLKQAKRFGFKPFSVNLTVNKFLNT